MSAPGDWYPWSEEAFLRARTADKPIFLSIGYSTCHWCHVMAHESFEDNEVAKLLNDVFICVKVDREERPDIDRVYMDVTQLMTGHGGWPLTVLLTPDGEPFFAATYLPKHTRGGMLGLMDLALRVRDIWRTERHRVTEVIQNVRAALESHSNSNMRAELGPDVLEQAFNSLESRFDDRNGGFGDAPKFPSAHILMFLLRYWRRSHDVLALHMVEKTLQEMRKGGIFDHIGYGFHRYSTDATWTVPHFEKMLYDQALLMMAYLEAYQATYNESYADVVHEIAEYVKRELRSPEGGFFTAEDADSEDEEGRYYLWTTDELREVLTGTEAHVFFQYFNISDDGNYSEEVGGRRSGRNILYQTHSRETHARTLGLDQATLAEIIEKCRRELLSVRSRRPRPNTDDKILTDWNGLMIAALARAGAVLDRQDYVELASTAAAFILERMSADGVLFHSYRDGHTGVTGFLDDYVFLTWGLIELYEATFMTRYLEAALQLNERAQDLFWDEREGGLLFSGRTGEVLFSQRKDAHDGALPSGNSVAALNNLRLSRLTGNPSLEDRARAIIRHFSSQVASSPSAFSMMLAALDYLVGPSYEVVIVSGADQRASELLRELRRRYMPTTAILLKKESENPKLTELAPFTRYYVTKMEQTTAYVCRDRHCFPASTDMLEILRYLDLV
ncbi:MAG: thioredoxin domain-containing protein [Candidatus Thorarchaeota archaeon]